MATFDREVLSRNNEKHQWGGVYFEFNELKPSSSKEQKKYIGREHEQTRTRIKHRKERRGEIFVELSNRGPQRL